MHVVHTRLFILLSVQALESKLGILTHLPPRIHLLVYLNKQRQFSFRAQIHRMLPI